jgi:RNA polymerase sigma-70 factor (ECF subfamily)
MLPDPVDPPAPPEDAADPPGTSGPGRKTEGAPASKQRPPDAPVPPLAHRILPTSPVPAPILEGPFPAPAVSGSAGRAGGPSRAVQDHWVARLREGDAGALREVVEAFQERITSVVVGMLRDRDAVEDVVQETFVKAFYRIGSFQGDSGLYTWLYRVAINLAKDHVKRHARRPAVALDEAGPQGAALPGAEAPALERVEQRERRLAVRAAIAALPPKFRAVLVLREIEGLRYDEIAEILSISQGTVESRLFRARRRLAARLSRWEPSR